MTVRGCTYSGCNKEAQLADGAAQVRGGNAGRADGGDSELGEGTLLASATTASDPTASSCGLAAMRMVVAVVGRARGR